MGVALVCIIVVIVVVVCIVIWYCYQKRKSNVAGGIYFNNVVSVQSFHYKILSLYIGSQERYKRKHYAVYIGIVFTPCIVLTFIMAYT